MRTRMNQDLENDVQAAEVGDLAGPAPIGEYHDQESARTFSGRGLVAILESPFLDFAAAKVIIEGPVPVVDDGGKVIGYASVALQGLKLIAEYSIRYDTPERLSIETQSPPMYFRARGYFGWVGGIPYQEEVLDLVGSKTVVDELAIDGLVLSQTRPTDERVPPVGEPIL